MSRSLAQEVSEAIESELYNKIFGGGRIWDWIDSLPTENGIVKTVDTSDSEDIRVVVKDSDSKILASFDVDVEICVTLYTVEVKENE